MIDLRLLGGFAIMVDDAPLSGRAAQRHRLALLALLGASRTEPVSREKLADYLWPEAGPRGRHLLSNSVHLIRKALGEEAVLGTADALRLNPERVRCDVRDLEAALASGDLRVAVELYRGSFLDGFFLADTPEFETWVDRERDRLARAYGQALEALALESEAGDDYRSAAEWWRRLRGVDPLAPRIVLRLMRALEAVEEVEQAVLCARAYESRVRGELGLEPDRAVILFAERLARERSQPASSEPGSRGDVAAGSGPGGADADSAGDSAAPGSSVRPRTVGRRRRLQALVVGPLLLVVGIVVALRLPEAIARSVLRELDARLVGGSVPTPGPDRSPNVAANELYRLASDETVLRSDSTAVEALERFRRAIALDPGFAGAHAGLAVMYLRLRWGAGAARDMPRQRWVELAEEAALRSVALNDSLADAHDALGSVRFVRLDLEAAEDEFRRAVALDPQHTSARSKLSRVLMLRGRTAEALREAEEILERDPVSPIGHAEAARALTVAGRCDEALERLEPLADLDPPLLRAAPLAAQCHAQRERWPEAIAWLERITDGRAQPGDALLGYVYARAGRNTDALEIHRGLMEAWERGGGDALAIAISYAGLRAVDEALVWLRRAAIDGSLSGTRLTWVVEPAFAEVRQDPRFQGVARAIGLQNW
jgi:DNA-binding SARP family transcriptional activator